MASETNQLVPLDAVADYFLTKVDRDAGESITNLKLQKLAYYAQAWHLAIFGGPLFDGRIEAWAHGPVVRALYARFGDHGWNPIPPDAVKGYSFDIFSKPQMELLEEVWSVYGELGAKQLENLTHSEEPWKEAYGNRPLGTRCDEEIRRDTMARFYKEKLERANAEKASKAQ